MTKKIALISGASGGIGRATARLLAALDYRVYLAARRRKKLEKLASEIVAERGEAVPVVLDLQNSKMIQDCVELITRREVRLDLLVNNAGYGIYGLLDEIPVDEARKLFETNYFGTVELSLKLVGLLENSPAGRIVNVASGVAKAGFPVMAHYAASKAALESFSESLREELAPQGIVVQVVYPLRTKTEFSTSAVRYAPEGFSFPEHGPTQEAARVAAAIVAGLRKKKFRIHPHFSTKFLGILNELFPWLVRKLLGFSETVKRAKKQQKSDIADQQAEKE